MISTDNLVNGLMGFYIVGSIVLLAIAIVAFPTLWERAQKNARKKKKR